MENLKDWNGIHEKFGKKERGSKRTNQQNWEQLNLTYQDAQILISAGFEPDNYYLVKGWKDRSFTAQEVKIWREVGLKSFGYPNSDAEFAAYLRGKNIQPNPSLNLEQLREEFNTWKEGEKPAKEYLEAIFPKSERSTITSLDLYQKNLTGSLDLRDFVNLGYLNCSVNKLTNLDLSKCKKLTYLSIHNNNLCQDLSFVQDFVNLEDLQVNNNPIYGNLEFLKVLSKLKNLNISNTDLDFGLEYLPDSLEKFYCSSSLSWWISKNYKKNYKVEQLAEEFGSFKKENGDYSGRDIKLWKEARQDKQQIQTLQKQQSQFQDQETQINYLELRVQELTNLIKTQKEKIISTFLQIFSERDLLQELITNHLEFIKLKKQKKPSSKLRKHCEELRGKLEESLGEAFMDKIENVLTDCEELVSWELELEERLKGKTSLTEEQKQTLLQITDSNENQKQIIAIHQATQQKEQEKLQEAIFQENYLRSQLGKVEELTCSQGSEQQTQIIQQQPFGFPSSSKN